MDGTGGVVCARTSRSHSVAKSSKVVDRPKLKRHGTHAYTTSINTIPKRGAIFSKIEGGNICLFCSKPKLHLSSRESVPLHHQIQLWVCFAVIVNAPPVRLGGILNNYFEPGRRRKILRFWGRDPLNPFEIWSFWRPKSLLEWREMMREGSKRCKHFLGRLTAPQKTIKSLILGEKKWGFELLRIP